jgi:DNA-binding CsgD family transcriptional regulator
MSRRSTNKPQNAREGDSLTRRELQVLALASAGETTPAISKRLGVTQNTVKTHLTSVYRKTGSHNRVQAARHYLRHYAIAPDDNASTQRSDRRSATLLIRQQIQALQARLDQLAPTVTEAERRRQTLAALRTIQLD